MEKMRLYTKGIAISQETKTVLDGGQVAATKHEQTTIDRPPTRAADWFFSK